MPTTIRGVEIAYGKQTVLGALDWKIASGEHWAVTGPSGSGKSSLLHCLAGIIKPSKGEIVVDEVVVSALAERKARRWRLENCGIVFQFGDLVPELTLWENVALPAQLLGLPRHVYAPRVDQLLHDVGIADHAGSLPTRVSGGQMQRASIARAIVHSPGMVLADEPTGALDHEISQEVISVLIGAARAVGSTLIVVTHDLAVAARFHQRLALDDVRVGV